MSLKLKFRRYLTSFNIPTKAKGTDVSLYFDLKSIWESFEKVNVRGYVFIAQKQYTPYQKTHV